MDFNVVSDLEFLKNMDISDRPADPEQVLYVFNVVNVMLAHIMEKMEPMGLQQTDYMDINMYIDLPSTYYVEMDVPVKLNFPGIQPVRSSTGLIYLTAQLDPGSESELLSPDGYIRCDSVGNFIGNKFNEVLASIPSIWTVKCIQKGQNHSQTIEIKSEIKSEMLTIYMNLIPVFEFSGSQWPMGIAPVPTEIVNKFPWFVIPWQNSVNNDDRAFMPYAPFWLNEMLKEMPTSILFLNLLISWHARRAPGFPNLSAYILKDFMLQICLVSGLWNGKISEITKLMPELLMQLNSLRLESYLVQHHNLLECMSFGDIQQCIVTFEDICTEAPLDMPEFWLDVFKRFPDSSYWFSNYVAFYTNKSS